jgi:phosphoribosylanthranilate isomerase
VLVGPPRRGLPAATAYTQITVSTKVKICGITNLGDAELAAACGAWAIGLVFHGASPRRCDLDAAAAIGTALKRRTEIVGVFVNPPLDELVGIAESTGLTMLQLHGEEGPAFCEEARRRTGLKVIKAARVGDSAHVRALAAYHTDFHLLDSRRAGAYGGTGESFDWSLAAEHRRDPPVILAGGLTPDNAQAAIAEVRPFAIDSSTGVESAPGRKDPERVRALFDAVRETAPSGV